MRPHRPAGEVAEAKAKARRAYTSAKDAGGLGTVMADKLWADTLLAVEGQRAETRAEMFRRTEILFALLADRATWPR